MAGSDSGTGIADANGPADCYVMHMGGEKMLQAAGGVLGGKQCSNCTCKSMPSHTDVQVHLLSLAGSMTCMGGMNGHHGRQPAMAHGC